MSPSSLPAFCPFHLMKRGGRKGSGNFPRPKVLGLSVVELGVSCQNGDRPTDPASELSHMRRRRQVRPHFPNDCEADCALSARPSPLPPRPRRRLSALLRPRGHCCTFVLCRQFARWSTWIRIRFGAVAKSYSFKNAFVSPLNFPKICATA